MHPRLRTALIVLLLFLATWLPRVVALDAFVTADERKWLARSANFAYALAHGDWANTFQREHPGVTVMWAGALGLSQQLPDYPQMAPGYFGWNEEILEPWLKANTSVTPLEALVAGRWWVVLAVALSITAAFFPLRRLLGEATAAVAILFIAWMPWSVALSRQLHPDGLVSSLSFVAFVFFLGWLYGGRLKRDLVVSGIFMGLAWLTKTPAVFLVPIGGLLVAGEGWRVARGGWRIRWYAVNRAGEGRLAGGERRIGSDDFSRSGEGRGARGDTGAATQRGQEGSCGQLSQRVESPSRWKPLIGGYVIWGAVASATFFVLWPAIWLDPIGVFARMATEMEVYVAGHVNPNYFLGQIVADPGPLFYPVAYFFRITPATVVGLLAAVLAAFRHAPPFDRPLVRRTALGMVIFALVFTALMTIPAKKFDRYILPAFLALDVVAAIGWTALAIFVARLASRYSLFVRTTEVVTTDSPLAPHPSSLPPRPSPLAPRPSPLITTLILTLALVPLHALFTAATFPYYFTYYNPLAGGSRLAPSVMLVGWGDGLDQVGAWLNQQPDDNRRRAVSWYARGPLSYFFDGEAVGLLFGSPIPWLDTDFVVLYANQIQRKIPTAAAVDYFLAEPPAHVVEVGGLEMARIYDMHAIVDRYNHTDRPLEAQEVTVSWPAFRLAALRTWPDVQLGTVLPVEMVLDGTFDGTQKISARLINAAGALIAQQDVPATPDVRLSLFVPPDAILGPYTLYVMAYEDETLEPIADLNGQDLVALVPVQLLGPNGETEPELSPILNPEDE